MENATAAFLIAVRKSMRPIRATIGATTIKPDLLTCAERLQYEDYLRREEINAAILALARDGVGSNKSFARPAIAGNLSVMCSGAFMAMFSGRIHSRTSGKIVW
jgi:hypothetical protein